MKKELMSAAVVLAAACGSALADIKVFIAQEHYFHEPTAWSPTGVPTAQDRIVIPADNTCHMVLDATVDTVDVQADGLLVVQGESAGTTLTLMNSVQNLATGMPDNSLIDGVLWVHNQFGSPSLHFAESHTISGDGVMSLGTSGLNPTKIVIDEGKTVTNELAVPTKGIRGSFDMIPAGQQHTMPAYFHNKGIVAADGIGGTVRLAYLVALTDIPGALWSVDYESSAMVFEHTAPSLQGDISVLAECGGHFVFRTHVTTCGAYTRRTGSLTVEGGGPFRYVTFISTPGTCGNPGTASEGVGCGGQWLEFFVVEPGNVHAACCP